MDDKRLVQQAAARDVAAFVELTRRFQHFAFGAALILVRDFHRAEDVVQEAFIAAWEALPSLAEPAAFPGWLRAIVRHYAFRMLRRKELELVPLAEADEVASEEPSPDRLTEAREQAAAALAAIASLPTDLREPALLFFVHECSHQDIATFLNLPVATVNNRLHAARKRLKERTLTMVSEKLHQHTLPDDFANRIGRLIAARGPVVEALFDPAAMPDLLGELVVSDEAQKRAVNIQVVQRADGGVVRGIALSSVDAVPRGATVLNAGRQARTAVDLAEFGGIVARLRGSPPGDGLFETGIKVIDVMCPLVAGGTVAFAGERNTGVVVVSEEIVRRVAGGNSPMSFFVLAPPPPPDVPGGWSFAGELKREGYSEGTIGAVQTFFLRCDGEAWNADGLAMLDAADVVIRLSRDRALAKIYPAVDVLTSRSCLLETKAVSDEHVTVAARVRQALSTLWSGAVGSDRTSLERALKIQNYFTQPFFCAEPYTKREGTTVSLAEALRTCREILDGEHDDVPTSSFYFSGGLAEIKGNLGRQLSFGPVQPLTKRSGDAARD